jgi:hypothetical protein
VKDKSADRLLAWEGKGHLQLGPMRVASVPRDTKSVTLFSCKRKMYSNAMLGISLSLVHLYDCRVPLSRLIGAMLCITSYFALHLLCVTLFSSCCQNCKVRFVQ